MPVQTPLYEVYNEFNQLLDVNNLNNLRPIFHAPIDQHLGINISGKMKTADATPNGDICYITVARNPNIIAAHDGYGLAWRKQPEHLIRVANAELATNPSSALSLIDGELINKFYLDYGITAEDAVSDAQSSGVHIKDNERYLKYNVFLVDNDILKEDVWVSPEMLWDQTGGKNQFLQAAKKWIVPNTWYNYNIKIYDKLGIDAWIYETDNPPTDPTSMEHRTIWRGQTYPPYVAMARYWGTKDSDKVAYFGGLAGGHFGIGVEDTHNAEWHFDDLLIESFIETFPMHLFKFKPSSSDFPSDGPLTVTYKGVGYDDERYLQDDTIKGFVRAWVWNISTNTWDIIGSNTKTPKNLTDGEDTLTVSNSFEPISNYTDGDGHVQVIAHPANSGPAPGTTYNSETNQYEQTQVYVPETGQWEVVTTDYSQDANHKLESYYVSISNASLEGFHKGNAIDVYVHDPSNVKVGVTTVTLDNDYLVTGGISGIDHYIQEFIEIRQHISQTVLNPNTYSIQKVQPGRAFSGEDSYKIHFSQDNLEGSRLDLVYKYWTVGDTIQTFLNSDDNRAPGADVMVKLMPPYFIKLTNLEYSSGPAPSEMRGKIIEAINNSTAVRLDKSDIINIFYNAGATYVNTDFDMELTTTTTDFVFETQEKADTYKIPEGSLARFFTTNSRLVGIIQI